MKKISSLIILSCITLNLLIVSAIAEPAYESKKGLLIGVWLSETSEEWWTTQNTNAHFIITGDGTSMVFKVQFPYETDWSTLNIKDGTEDLIRGKDYTVNETTGDITLRYTVQDRKYNLTYETSNSLWFGDYFPVVLHLAGVPYKILSDSDILNGDLSQYAGIIAPSVIAVPYEDYAIIQHKIESYVKDGGVFVAMGHFMELGKDRAGNWRNLCCDLPGGVMDYYLGVESKEEYDESDYKGTLEEANLGATTSGEMTGVYITTAEHKYKRKLQATSFATKSENSLIFTDHGTGETIALGMDLLTETSAILYDRVSENPYNYLNANINLLSDIVSRIYEKRGYPELSLYPLPRAKKALYLSRIDIDEKGYNKTKDVAEVSEKYGYSANFYIPVVDYVLRHDRPIAYSLVEVGHTVGLLDRFHTDLKGNIKSPGENLRERDLFRMYYGFYPLYEAPDYRAGNPVSPYTGRLIGGDTFSWSASINVKMSNFLGSTFMYPYLHWTTEDGRVSPTDFMCVFNAYNVDKSDISKDKHIENYVDNAIRGNGIISFLYHPSAEYLDRYESILKYMRQNDVSDVKPNELVDFYSGYFGIDFVSAEYDTLMQDVVITIKSKKDANDITLDLGREIMPAKMNEEYLLNIHFDKLVLPPLKAGETKIIIPIGAQAPLLYSNLDVSNAIYDPKTKTIKVDVTGRGEGYIRIENLRHLEKIFRSGLEWSNFTYEKKKNSLTINTRIKPREEQHFIIYSSIVMKIEDTDQDKISDEAEINIYHTDPNNPDTDGDGLLDGGEIELGLDPLRQDTDEDGIPDGGEIELGLDPLRQDTDEDGMPDGWEVRYFLDPLRDDSSENPDGDLWNNSREYLLGKDPRVKDIKEIEKKSIFKWSIAIFVILCIFAGVLFNETVLKRKYFEITNGRSLRDIREEHERLFREKLKGEITEEEYERKIKELEEEIEKVVRK